MGSEIDNPSRENRIRAYWLLRKVRLHRPRHRRFTTVYLGTDLVTGRRTAVKLLHSVETGLKRNFRCEIDVLRHLQGSGSALFLVEAGKVAGAPYHMCEWVGGLPLDSPKLRYLAVAEKLRVLLAACEAVQDVHERGVVHRDISPDHVFIGPGNQARLIDFGMARFTSGKKGRRPCEYAQYDILALGLLFCELLLAEPLFSYRDPLALRIEIPAALERLGAYGDCPNVALIVRRCFAARSEMGVGLRAPAGPFGDITELITFVRFLLQGPDRESKRAPAIASRDLSTGTAPAAPPAGRPRLSTGPIQRRSNA